MSAPRLHSLENVHQPGLDRYGWDHLSRLSSWFHLHDWFEEFRLYHRKDGKVVKEGDDLMAATRYAIMMLRFASTARSYHNFRRKIVYPKLSIA